MMIFRTKSAPIDFAFRALLVAICFSVSLGNAPRFLLPSLSPTDLLTANDGLLTNTEAQPASEETPEESPGSNELAEEGALADASQRKNFTKAKFRFPLARKARIQIDTALALKTAYDQSANSQSEHCFRNGCGTDLRC
jgi:hypothetical protein